MAFEKINSKGQKYYLHSKGRLMFFSKNAEGSIDLPENMDVIENKRTGLPMVRKKA